MKVLYFEGAGMDYETNEFSNVGNYRIRTAFTNNEGTQYYIELGRSPRYDNKFKTVSEWALRIDHLFKIEDRFKEELKYGSYEIKYNHKEIAAFDYTVEDITDWINENLYCSFDSIEVLDMFHGYRVHADDGGYNVIENAEIDHNRAAKRKQAYNKIDMEYRKLLNEKYSKIGLQDMDNQSITIRCFAGDTALGTLPRQQRIEI